MVDIENQLWVDRYRPKTLSEYVFTDDKQKSVVQRWVEEGSIPHLLLYGGAGTGKSTLARVLINDLDIDEGDVLYINASRDNGVDMIRRRITQFSETMPWGKFKIIFLDEADHLTPEAQGALRATIEQYSSIVRFILTCNYVNRITPPIKSRCQSFFVTNHDIFDFTTRAAEILLDNDVDFDLDTLNIYVKANYPDLRKTINSLQQNVIGGKLENPEDEVGSDWKLKMVQLFQDGKLKEARKFICEKATPEDYDEIFRFLYRNLEFFGDTDDKQDEAVIIIRNGLVKQVSCADLEMNLSATMIELTRLKNEAS